MSWWARPDRPHPGPSWPVQARRGFVRQQHCTAEARAAPSEGQGTSQAWGIRNGHGKLSGQREWRHGGDPGPAGPPTDRHCPSVGLGSMARYQPLPLPPLPPHRENRQRNPGEEEVWRPTAQWREFHHVKAEEFVWRRSDHVPRAAELKSPQSHSQFDWIGQNVW